MKGLFAGVDLDADEWKKVLAWGNAEALPGSQDRRDCDGRIIRWSEYGQRTVFGWHIDHAVPTALGGLDAPSNLRARHWLGNCSAGGILGALLGSSR